MSGLKPQALFTNTPISESGRTAYEIRNKSAFAAIRDDGSVVTWGDPKTGGDSSEVIDRLRGDVVQIYATRKAFAALKADGSVITWGDRRQGGNSDGVKNDLMGGVVDIFSTGTAFVALKRIKLSLLGVILKEEEVSVKYQKKNSKILRQSFLWRK